MLTLHNKDFTTKYGTINTTIEAFVEEERNGLFELSFIMLNTDSLFNYVKEDNIVVANANDTLLNQKFRIYMTRKLMNNRVEVFARHISFDLMYDYIDSVKFENQSCEYALNSLFRGSQFSKHYKGYSDIINAQDYNMSMANILEAIGGKKGSIIDTYGTGAELLRDNENIHVLNKRGHDNSVSIEYKKNLTGFELEEDTTELITRILPYAKYTPQDEEGNSQDEVVVKGNFVDSPLIDNYSHPFIKAIDYSDKFDDENIPTADKLKALAELEYKNNKVDIPKQNFKIEFIPLSKCVGYEGLSDNISLCDTVTIKDTRYNINTQAKVIKVTYNVLKNRYESMELGEPKTSLGDIVGGNSGETSKGEQGPPGPQGPPGADGGIGGFPDSLPEKSILTGKSVGLASIELTWTFENKVYYSYELYASKTKDFKPNNFDLIYEGQASAFLFQAKPNETWYFRVCAINSHGNRNEFSDQISVSTAKINGNDWIENATIGNALIGDLSADKITSGTISGHYIDARNLSVTDGNGKRTLDIDSFGNVNLDVTSLKISSSNVATENYANNVANTAQTNATNSSKDYTDTKITETKSEIKVTTDSISQRVSSTESTTRTLNNKVTSQESRLLSAESKITPDAIVSTVTSSTTYRDDLSGKVDTNKVVSSINQTAEAIKISANKIDLNGVTTAGNLSGGRYIKIENESYSAYNNNTKIIESGVRWYNNQYVPAIYMGANGFNSQSSGVDGAYFAMFNFPSINGNPSIQHLATRNPRTDRWSIIEYTDTGNITIKAENAVNVEGASFNVNSTNTYINSPLYLTKTLDSKQINGTGIRVNGISKFVKGVGLDDNGNTLIEKTSTADIAVTTTAFIPKTNDSIYLGNNSYRWKTVYAINALNTSDKSYKENITYLGKSKSSNNVTHEDLHEFYRSRYKIATFNYKEQEHKEYGFITQDMYDDKVGETLIVKDEENGEMYSTGSYISSVAGALQYEINLRDKQIKELISKIEELEKAVLNKK